VKIGFEEESLMTYAFDFKKDIERLTRCFQCSYDFFDGQREPGLLKCNHSICIYCMQTAFSQGKDPISVDICCTFDQITTNILKVELMDNFLLPESQQSCMSFDAFWQNNVQINMPLLEYIANTGRPPKMNAIDFDIESEEDYDNLKVVKQKTQAELYADQEKFYDAECPICTMYFTNDNPPITLCCPGHPQHPLTICRNDLLSFYLRQGGKDEEKNDQDITLSCYTCYGPV
jgi:hypothetical protein